jgi:nicotinamidase-related amidase
VGRDPALGRRVSAGRGAGTLLDPRRALLVVIDLQQKLLPAIPDRERVLHNSLLLIRLAGVLELPVIVTTQYRKGLGEIVPEVTLAAPSVAPVDKVAFGCFGSEEFGARMAAFEGRDQLVVAGVESHICVAQTVLGALGRGLAVHVAADAVGSRTAENREVGLRRMEKAGAVISSAEMAIYELLGRSDAGAFKAMLPHLRG